MNQMQTASISNSKANYINPQRTLRKRKCLKDTLLKVIFNMPNCLRLLQSFHAKPIHTGQTKIYFPKSYGESLFFLRFAITIAARFTALHLTVCVPTPPPPKSVGALEWGQSCNIHKNRHQAKVRANQKLYAKQKKPHAQHGLNPRSKFASTCMMSAPPKR